MSNVTPNNQSVEDHTQRYYQKIAHELGINSVQVMAAAKLIGEGGTVPFIARYRKEATGSLDEVAVLAIRDRLEQLEELDKRRDAIVKSLRERELLTAEIQEKIAAAETLAILEDIYLPYRPKRRTRATVAREKGLEPLAQRLFDQEQEFDPLAEAVAFVDPEKDVHSAEDALAGARDIIAEWVNESEQSRARMREFYAAHALFCTHVLPGKEEEGKRYLDYYDWEEPAAAAPSHRILAMRRGEKEEFLSMRVLPPEAKAIELLISLFLRGSGLVADQVRQAVEDSYTRLLSNAMETEIRLTTKKRADGEAIRVFSDNLRQLLLAAPLGQKRVLALDPGFRTGCKTVCLNTEGKLLHHETIFPLLSEKNCADAALRIRTLCRESAIEAIAVGNGTGGRETEAFLRSLNLPEVIKIIMVNESGASVYSASQAARDEFPHEDVTVRGAVSIGRRLLDPLAELVKIDPKSIGVGQYQHDVDQSALKNRLDDVVMSCVNAVGVDGNTASIQLLTYVSGLGPALARQIVAWRDEHGPFPSRDALKKVPRLGARAFEQAAGFLRIRNGENPLDGSAVHPESYPIVDLMARDMNCTVSDLMHDDSLRQQIKLERYVTDQVGLPTLTDILAELAKPGRDPRETFEVFQFAEGIATLDDLSPGMRLPGIVTNITAFGAFVDIGIHQDGLVHVSQIADRYVKDPQEVLKVRQPVMVTVLTVDRERKRIALSLKKQAAVSANPAPGRETNDKEHSTTVHKQKSHSKHAPKGKPPDRNIPFNNPFAEAFGKK